MIYRRDRVRGVDLEPLVPVEPLVPEFFEGGIGTEEFFDAWSQGYPPTVAIALRPRRAVGLHLDFSVELDKKI
jgi:hypothetical protein